MTDCTQEPQTTGDDSDTLHPATGELAAARQQIARLEVAGQAHAAIEHILRERVKELNCLYGISYLVEKPGVLLEEILQGTVDLISAAWQYPEIAAARIVLDGQEFRTANWTDDVVCRQIAPITVRGRTSGKIEVCYLEDRPEGDEGPFLKEERSLLNAIAERLGKIVERMRTEQALAAGEREYRTLFETMAQGVVYQDASGRITAANPAAEWILGLTLDQMQGRTSMDPRWRAIRPDGSDFPGDAHPAMVALRTGREVRNVVMGVFNPRTEAYTWININAVPQFRATKGRPAGGQQAEARPYQVYATFEDITGQVQAAQALEQERDRAQRYLDIAGVILVVISADRTVALINKKGCEILGYNEGEIVGQDWFERFVPRQNRQTVVATFEQLMAGEIAPIEHFENPIVTRSGEERIIAWHNTVLRDAAGRIDGTLSSGEDITERVRAEQALRRAHDELEQRVAERTAELEQGRQREGVLNALLRLSMEEISPDEQLEQALDQILSIPWLPVLRRGAIFVTTGPGQALRLQTQRGLEPYLQTACAQIRFGQCICGRAAASGEIEFADRVDERHEIVYEGMPPHGHYCVPILSSSSPNLDHSSTIGVLVLYLEAGHRRSEQEEEFLRAIANTLASMIERGRAADTLRQNEQQLRELNRRLETYSRTLEQRVSERTRELERRRQVAEGLRNILAVLNSDRPLDEVLEHIVAEAGRLLQSDTSAIYRPREPGNRFEVQTVKGQSERCSDRTPLSPQLAQILRERRPVTFSDMVAGEPESEPTGISRPLPPGCLVHGCRAVLAVPLVIADAIYGALVLCYTQTKAFAEDEVELAVTFADQAALAIENARLHQHAREAAIVQERARLARELHDSVTQSLYSLTLLAEGWRRLGSTGRLGETDDPLKELGELAQQALKEMRLMVYELRPPALEQEGLLGALHQRLGAVERRAGVEARLLAQEIVELPQAVEEGLYWIATEALNNALKHASATMVAVHVGTHEGWVALEVLDNGLGFEPESVRDGSGMGLQTMRERAEELGGTLTIRSAPAEGTSLVARVPFGG